jgi:glycosyltransferase involved in cell wall biosynthesis
VTSALVELRARGGSQAEQLLVSVIIPARNEARTVGAVVRAAREARFTGRVLVVANACTDRTVEEAEAAGAEVLRLPCGGKGEAVLMGIEFLSPHPEDAVVLLDADLTRLTPCHIDDLAFNVIQGQAEMACGILAGRFWSNSFVPSSWSFHSFWTLTGQRCLLAGLLWELDPDRAAGFRLEVALNRLCVDRRLRVLRLPFSGVGHITKERKGSVPRGWAARLVMISQVYWTYAILWIHQATMASPKD